MKILTPTIRKDLNVIDNIDEFILSEDIISEVQIDSANLSGLTLKNTKISESIISKTNLTNIFAERFETINCNFKNCDLTTGQFPSSNWHMISIDSARLCGTQIQNSTIKNVLIKNSKLEIVNFRFSTLENIIFEDCNISDVDFYNAKLKNIEFINCTINSITFASAKMKNVDLSKSEIMEIIGTNSLKGVTISYEQLMQIAPYLAQEAGIKIK